MQLHPYHADLSYHFLNLALVGEAQPIWESDDSKHPDLEDLFAIPRPYYDELFLASNTPTDDLYEDIQGYIQQHYDVIGVIRTGVDVIPDYQEVDLNWQIEELEGFERIMGVLGSYSQRVTETLRNSVLYSFSNLLMGYALRAKDDSHGIIVIRGTVSSDEWFNNLNYQLVPFHPLNIEYGRVHNGIRDVYKGLRGRYRQLVDEFDTDMPLYLVGHSLGAAISQLAALDIAIKSPERRAQMRVYAYAAPRAGDPMFAEVYDRLVATSYRIVNICDAIPYVPFEELGAVFKRVIHPYAHTKGELAFVHQAGNPIANHMSSYHLATKLQIPTTMDASYPQVLK